MEISAANVLVTMFVGLTAGWLAGQFVGGVGLGLVGDMAVGIVGAFIANMLFPVLYIPGGSALPGMILNATAGSIVFLLVAKLIWGRRANTDWR